MEEMLLNLQRRKAIMMFAVHDEDKCVRVNIWMDGTSYIDEAVRHVRKKVEASAKDATRPVKVTIAAVLECFDVGVESGETHRTYHQAVDKAD
jgi:hypothetical protein